MGLDITFMTKQKGKEYLSKYWMEEGDDEALLKLHSEKNEISKRRMSEEGDMERYEFLEKEISNKVDAINEANGITELYFRKVPRVVYVGLQAAAIFSRGGKDGDLVSEDDIKFITTGNWMIVDGEEKKELESRLLPGMTIDNIRYGNINLDSFKKAFDLFFNDSTFNGGVKILGSHGGFFWGDDTNTTDEEIKERYEKFLAEVERLQADGKLPAKDEDVVLEYNFSW